MNLSTNSIVLIFLLAVILALSFALFFSPFENREEEGQFERAGRELDQKIEEVQEEGLPFERP